jgi:hypothetical protein
MFHKFPINCCKDYVCDCCLNEDDIINKHINQELQRFRRQNLFERKLLLLGISEIDIGLCFFNVFVFFRKC